MRKPGELGWVCLIFSFTIAGCKTDSAMQSPNSDTLFAVKRYSDVPIEREARLELEKALVNQLMATAPPDQRPVLQQLIVDDPEAIGNVQTVRGSAKVAELIGRIYSLREANHEERQRAMVTGALAGVEASVTVVLVRGGLGGEAARVIRTSEPWSKNVILLEDSELTPERLSAAMMILANSRLRHGERPTTGIRAHLPADMRAPPISAAERAWASNLIAELRSANPKPVAGYGAVPSVDIKIGGR